MERAVPAEERSFGALPAGDARADAALKTAATRPQRAPPLASELVAKPTGKPKVHCAQQAALSSNFHFLLYITLQSIFYMFSLYYR